MIASIPTVLYVDDNAKSRRLLGSVLRDCGVIELGHPGAVAQLGQEVIARDMEQIGQSDDEGETASAFADCLPVIFKAVAESSLPPARKLLFAIDALLQADYSVMESGGNRGLERAHPGSGCRGPAQPAIRSQGRVAHLIEQECTPRRPGGFCRNWGGVASVG